MLGTDVVKELQRRGIAHIALDRTACDVTSPDSCFSALARHRPAALINCAAYTDVNRAESEEDKAMAINATGAENLARACSDSGTFMVQVSTDYVYDGMKTEPYSTADATAPINAYGRSKLAGEKAVARVLPHTGYCIARTSWLFGSAGPNFVKTMLRLARDGKDLKIIHDQVGAPTYTVDLARALVDLAVGGYAGIFHVTGGGACSWFEFAQEIFNQAGVHPPTLEPCASDEFPTPAKRPASSRLSDRSIVNNNIQPLPHWTDGLTRYLRETGELK